MEDRKNNTGLVVLITVLVMIVLGLVGFIIYDKFSKDDNSNNINNNIQKENIAEPKPFIDVEKLKKNVSKVLSFTNLNNDFTYLKLSKIGILSIGIDSNSTLYNKYSNEYIIAKDVLDVYIFNIGTGGYQYIYALKKDGTIDRMEIPMPAKDSDFKWEENYKGLKNIIYLDIYSDETPKTVNDADELFDVYNQVITAVDIDGNIYNLDLTTESIWVKK